MAIIYISEKQESGDDVITTFMADAEGSTRKQIVAPEDQFYSGYTDSVAQNYNSAVRNWMSPEAEEVAKLAVDDVDNQMSLYLNSETKHCCMQ